MKFEQALKLLRAGEICRSPWTKKLWKMIWANPANAGQKDCLAEEVYHTATGDSREWVGSAPCGLDILMDGWKVIRKKKKPTPPRFSEDELEPVGTLPRVGDRVWNAQPEHTGILRESMLTLAMVDGGWAGSVEGRLGGYSLCPANFYDGHVRIMKRPPEALRDVFKDPRVGDVVRAPDCAREYVVKFFDDTMIACWGDVGGAYATTRSHYSTHGPRWEVVSRAP